MSESETTALVASPESSPAPAPSPALATFDASDMVVPRLAIVQPTSAKAKESGGKEGCLYDNVLGANFESVRLVPVDIAKGRVFFEDGGVACKSLDGIAPAPFLDSPLAERCKDCSYGQWKDRTPPQCGQTYTILGYRPDDEMPCLLTLKGMALKHVKPLITVIQMRRLQSYQVETTLTLVKQSNAKGTFFVPNFGGIKTCEPKDKYREIAEALLGAQGGGGEGGEARSAGNDEDIPF